MKSDFSIHNRGQGVITGVFCGRIMELGKENCLWNTQIVRNLQKS